MEYQRIGAWWHGPFVSTGRFPFGGLVQERGGFCGCRVVFGTLLGPEATGPRVRSFLWGVSRDVCFWFPGCTDYTVWFPLWGLVCGVCGTGLLFENYIVDASIFYKKQFPRI